MYNEPENPIPAPVQDFYELFKQDFSNVTFPDISLEVLDKLIDEVHEKMKVLQEANDLVKTAQEALECSQNELLQKSIRGLAYAKIYAEDQEELLDRLSGISLGKSNRVTKKANTEPAAAKRQKSKKTEKTDDLSGPDSPTEE